jgi:hypothetical protein
VAEVFASKTSVDAGAMGMAASSRLSEDQIVNPGHFNGNHLNSAGSRRMRRNIKLSGPALHRIAVVMEQEGISPRSAARQMNLTQLQVYEESHPSCDLRLSALYRWQTALQVPVGDLLREPDPSLSPQVRLRCNLLKAMRTVRTIQERAQQDDIQALAGRLAEQLTELMPELASVPSWPAVGQRRTMDEMGAVVDHQMSDLFFSAPPSDD